MHKNDNYAQKIHSKNNIEKKLSFEMCKYVSLKLIKYFQRNLDFSIFGFLTHY